jgi:hypothetical protein
MDDAVTPPPAPQPFAPAPASSAPAPASSAPAPASSAPAPASSAPAPASSAPGDGFDRARVLGVVARIERDVALVEQAMTSLEAGEHRAAESALSVLEAGNATG